MEARKIFTEDRARPVKQDLEHLVNLYLSMQRSNFYNVVITESYKSYLTHVPHYPPHGGEDYGYDLFDPDRYDPKASGVILFESSLVSVSCMRSSKSSKAIMLMGYAHQIANGRTSGSLQRIPGYQ